MVMLAFAMMGRIRHHANPPQPKKNATPNQRKNKTIVASSLIRWSIQEVRRIAIRLAESGSNRHIIAWSLWRRAHQAIAQRSHIKAKRQL